MLVASDSLPSGSQSRFRGVSKKPFLGSLRWGQPPASSSPFPSLCSHSACVENTLPRTRPLESLPGGGEQAWSQAKELESQTLYCGSQLARSCVKQSPRGLETEGASWTSTPVLAPDRHSLLQVCLQMLRPSNTLPASCAANREWNLHSSLPASLLSQMRQILFPVLRAQKRLHQGPAHISFCVSKTWLL